MTQIRCTAFPTHSNHPLSRPSRYASLANELEGYKYTIKYDDGDAEEFSEKGGRRWEVHQDHSAVQECHNRGLRFE